MRSLVNITPENYQIFLEPILMIENVSFLSPWSLKSFTEEINNRYTNLWAIMVDEFLSGYICFWMFDSEIQLINVAVHPRERGKGFGHYLLTKMIESGVSKGIQYIWLEVRTTNLVAKRLYGKLGFGEVIRRPLYYTDTNEDAIVMSLALSRKKSHPSVVN